MGGRSGAKLVRTVPSELAARLGQVAAQAIDKAVDTRWDAARERAARLAGSTIDERVSALAKTFARELGAAGAVAGGTAAIPGVGTGAAVAASLTEFGYFTLRTSELVLTIGALHGHHEASVQEQRAWIMSVLLFGNGASEGFRKLAGEVGKGLGAKATAKVPRSALSAINGALGRTIFTKYGTKRGVVALGRVLPFGIGAAVGGGANYAGARVIAKQADRFFRDLPYEREGSE